jgi:hypothetical protein
MYRSAKAEAGDKYVIQHSRCQRDSQKRVCGFEGRGARGEEQHSKRQRGMTQDDRGVPIEGASGACHGSVRCPLQGGQVLSKGAAGS